MSRRLLSLTQELAEEMELLIEEDDGTIFTIRHIELVEEILDLLKEEAQYEP